MINWSHCISKALRFCCCWGCHWEAAGEPWGSWCYKPLCNLQPEFIHSLLKPSGGHVSHCDITDCLLTIVNPRPFKGKQSSANDFSPALSAGTYLCRCSLHLSMCDLIWVWMPVRLPVCAPQWHLRMAKTAGLFQILLQELSLP